MTNGDQQTLPTGTRRHLWIVLLPVVVVLLMLLAAAWLFWWPNRFEAPEKVVRIYRGSSFQAVMDSLASAGVITNRTSFELAGRVLGLTDKIRFGQYRFRSGMSNLAIYRDLTEGLSNEPIAVRIVEGMRFQHIAGRLRRELGVDSSLIATLCVDREFIRSLGIPASSLEGYLLPDTYRFSWQTDEVDLLRTLVKAFQDFYVDSLKVRQERLGLTLHEVLTLASIVEGETSLDAERATIAGVYFNRLRARMPLQADPTIQYIIPDGPRRLSYSDLKINSPYNTYRYSGLPPGPINNPGRQSILAVLYPERHQYFYFVADGSGGHKFSRNYSEHLRAVRNWRKIRQDQQARNTTSG
jgi:UPF0755 protein